MLKTINAVGATKIWRNDRLWLAGDHLVDPRNKHLPKVKALIEMSEQAEKDYKLTNYMGQNVCFLPTPASTYYGGHLTRYFVHSTLLCIPNLSVKGHSPECL